MIDEKSGSRDTTVVPRAGSRSRLARIVMGRTLRARRGRIGMLLVSPAFALVAVFVLFPLGFAVYISLTNWPLIGSYHYVGGANYSELAHDPVFIHSVLFTLLYTAIVTGPKPFHAKYRFAHHGGCAVAMPPRSMRCPVAFCATWNWRRSRSPVTIPIGR